MLDRLVIHLKNIIFFKVVIYIIVIILLGATIARFQEQLIKSLERKEKANILFHQSIVKLNSIIDFEKKISETSLKYQDLIANYNKKSCGARPELIKDLALISQKHKLYEPIKAEISRVFEAVDNQNKTSNVVLHYYELVINFTVNSQEEAIALSEDIYSILPKGSVILKMQIKNLQVLTPQVIEKLSTKGCAGFVNGSVKVLLREIIYEK